MMEERVVRDENLPGVELLEIVGAPGYEDEKLLVSNGLLNGLRIEILNEDTDWTSFHIHSPETARVVAAKLLEWCKRIADPPQSSQVSP